MCGSDDMNILISPAKKMRRDISYIEAKTIPVFLHKTKELLAFLKTLNPEQVKTMLVCNTKIAAESYLAYQNMDITKDVVPALLSFVGIQYTYMAPDIFEDSYFNYVEEHLYILSGFYGLLRAFDGVVPYRLELDNKLPAFYSQNLYAFWKDALYKELVKTDNKILNLASKQYSRIIERYLEDDIHLVTCHFKEIEKFRLIEKGVYVKMARGEMVRYLVEINAQSFEDVKGFHRLGYMFNEALSDEHTFIFTRDYTAYRRKIQNV